MERDTRSSGRGVVRVKRIGVTGGRGTADMVRRARRAGVPVWFPCGEP